MIKKSNSLKKKFFIKENDEIYVVYNEFFEDIESRDEALFLVMKAYEEIHITLKQEIELGYTLYIENMKVTTGLQRSIDELEKRWPFLLTEFNAIQRRINGSVLFLC